VFALLSGTYLFGMTPLICREIKIKNKSKQVATGEPRKWFNSLIIGIDLKMEMLIPSLWFGFTPSTDPNP
jgi:hypothetical protein